MAAKLLLPTIRDRQPSAFRLLADSLLNLLYPDECVVCSHPVARFQECSICPECWEKILALKIDGGVCPSCGLPYRAFETESRHLCGKCTLQIPPYSGARAFGLYSAELSRVIQALKFDTRRNLAKLLSPMLVSTFLKWWQPGEFDLVVAVPLHPARRRQRGYNQSELLAKPFSRQLAIPFYGRVLTRVGGLQPQVGLSDAERAVNVRGAFRCTNPAAIAGKRVLLVDDVMTTGATVGSAAETLLSGGALRVSVLTLARTAAGWD
jgi:ComF family protein